MLTFTEFIVESEKVFVDLKTYDFVSLFNYLNAKCFYNKLVWIPVKIKTLVHSGGTYSFNRNKKTNELILDSQYITISNAMKLTDQDVKNIYAHELIHYYIAYALNDLIEAHGRLFKSEMQRVNGILSHEGYNITLEVEEGKMKDYDDKKINMTYYLIVSKNKDIGYCILGEKNKEDISEVIQMFNDYYKNNTEITVYKTNSAYVKLFKLHRDIKLKLATGNNINNINNIINSEHTEVYQ